MTTEIAIIENINEDKWPEIYGVGKVNDYYDRVKDYASKEIPDVSTAKGRAAIASLSGKVSSSKTAVEKPGRAYLKKIKEKSKIIEAELRDFVILMDKLRDDTRQPLTDWENEQERIKAEKEAEEARQALLLQIENDHEIALLMNEKFDREAVEAKALAEQQRIEYEARIAAEAAEKATREAEEKAAQAQRDAQLAIERAERQKAEAEAAVLRQQQEAELAAKRAAEKAEQDKLFAIEQERQRVATENKRLADIKAAEDAAEAKRIANKNHQKKINNEILDDLVLLGCSEDLAKSIITSIAKDQIRNLFIRY